MDFWGAECLDEPLSLEFLFIFFHRQGHINRQHEREIDLGFRLSAPCPEINTPAASRSETRQRPMLIILSSGSDRTCYVLNLGLWLVRRSLALSLCGSITVNENVSIAPGERRCDLLDQI